MIINKKEYEKLKEISKLTITDYNITLVEQDKYWLPEDSVMNIIDDLKYEYDELAERIEEKEQQDEQTYADFLYDKWREEELMK